MPHRRVLAPLALLCAFLVLPGTGFNPLPAGADESTPTVTSTTAEPTIAPVSPVVPTLAPPIIRRERTPVAVFTAVPVPSPTVARVTNTPLPAPTATIAAPDASSLYPSPDELRLDARLRWGKRIPTEVRRWAYLIVPAARRYHLDPNLVAAVITMESGGDPSAWNTASDARGLMQVLHGPFDPAENIVAGTSMLARFLHKFHHVDLALAAYNAGPGAVIQFTGIPPYHETRDYVIIVGYLYDLYGHRSLTSKRRSQYRATVQDLRRFANQRKKVKLLSGIANFAPGSHRDCTVLAACETTFDERAFPTMDPFWPMPGPPDPLQRVGPAVSPS